MREAYQEKKKKKTKEKEKERKEMYYKHVRTCQEKVSCCQS